MNDQQEIIETIYRFANGLDLKDWAVVRNCFANIINTDYSDLRGEPPMMISAEDYISARRSALSELITQHLSSNHVVSVDGDIARCVSQMIIYRRKDEEFFNTHCYYEHTFTRTSSGWKINGVKQKVWWSEGNSDIHSGAK